MKKSFFCRFSGKAIFRLGPLLLAGTVLSTFLLGGCGKTPNLPQETQAARTAVPLVDFPPWNLWRLLPRWSPTQWMRSCPR